MRYDPWPLNLLHAITVFLCDPAAGQAEFAEQNSLNNRGDVAPSHLLFDVIGECILSDTGLVKYISVFFGAKYP